MVNPEDTTKDNSHILRSHLYHDLALPQRVAFSPQNSPSKQNDNQGLHHNHSQNHNHNQTHINNQNINQNEVLRIPNSNLNHQNGLPQNQISAPSVPLGPLDLNANLKPSTTKNDHMNMNSRKQRKQRTCKKCQKPIIGTLVRALDNVYHIDCFTCYDCGKQCSQKFFSMDLPSLEDSLILKPYPLCEYDYFKRLDVICYTCDTAIRGSYITALGRKYHPEHFYCDVCHKLFESDDYYANDGKIFCHYHYSQLHAFNCAGCHSAILKQYVELHKGGVEQQWHPECFMVHKFWNVDVTVDCVGLGYRSLDEVKNYKNENKLIQAENSLEKLTVDIWCTLSEFEEYCASCISEMLHSATMLNKHRGLSVTAHLVLKIETLFLAFDALDKYSKNSMLALSALPLTHLKKEPRLLSGKILFYLTFCRDITEEKINDPKNSQDLLSLISALAHYIKLISRTGISVALDYNKLSGTTKATDIFLKEILSSNNKADKNSLSNFPYLEGVTSRSNDSCEACGKSIEDSCVLWCGIVGSAKIGKRWHYSCLKCSKCDKEICSKSGAKNMQSNESLTESAYNPNNSNILCASCASQDVDAKTGFREVSRLLQFVYLLKIALLRSRAALNKSDIWPISHQSFSLDDEYDKQVNDITRKRSLREQRKIQTASKEIKKSIIIEAPIAGAAGMEDVQVSSESDTNRLGNAKKYFAKQSSLRRKESKNFKTEEIPNQNAHATNASITSNLLQNEKSLTLDDIPRIVSTEQAREYRPNAFRYQKRTFSPAISNLPVPKSINQFEENKPSKKNSDHESFTKGNGIADSSDATQKMYSDLNNIGHEYMRYVAAFVFWHSIGQDFNISLDDCLNLIDVKKNVSFWGRIFGKDKDNEDFIKNSHNNSEFKSGSATTSGSGNGVFGVPLSTVVRKYGVDSDLGIGESRVRIPALVDELIHAMKTQDVSAEGVFRLNGNIRKLRTLVEELDGEHGKPDEVLQRLKLKDETPIQLAAILKKFLRDLPVPLMTYKLYDIFLLSQGRGIKDEDEEKFQRRQKILKIAYAMLPKPNRDLCEVLFAFLAWVATFAHLESSTGEADGGSKMDTHNLATVLTPNILYSLPPSSTTDKSSPFSSLSEKAGGPGEGQFLSIEVVHEMIQNNDDLAIIPKQLYKIFTLAGFDSAPGVRLVGDINGSRIPSVETRKKEQDTGLVSKDIIAKLKNIMEKSPDVFNTW